MSKAKEYIEVLRVVSDDSKDNVCSRPEVIETDNIKSFRAWHKGPKDKMIKGEMTLLMFSEEKTFDNGQKKVMTMLIEESYKDFLDRMSSKVAIKKLEASA